MRTQQEWPFSKPLEFLHKVKYGGAVGKQIVAVVVALLVLGVVSISLWGQITAAYLVVPAVIIVLFGGLFSVHRTLDKGPSLAILEGSEYVEYSKVELAAKNMPIIPPTPAIPDPKAPAMLTIEAKADPEDA